MSNIICTSCGNQISINETGTAVCQNCGAKFDIGTTPKKSSSNVPKISSKQAATPKAVFDTSALPKQVKEAISIPKQAKEQPKISKDKSNLNDNYFEMAKVAFTTGNYAEAESYCNKIIENDVNNFKAWFLKAQLLTTKSTLEDNKLQESMVYFNKAIDYAGDEQQKTKSDAQAIIIGVVDKLIYARISNFKEVYNFDNFIAIYDEITHTQTLVADFVEKEQFKQIVSKHKNDFMGCGTTALYTITSNTYEKILQITKIVNDYVTTFEFQKDLEDKINIITNRITKDLYSFWDSYLPLGTEHKSKVAEDEFILFVTKFCDISTILLFLTTDDNTKYILSSMFIDLTNIIIKHLKHYFDQAMLTKYDKHKNNTKEYMQLMLNKMATQDDTSKIKSDFLSLIKHSNDFKYVSFVSLYQMIIKEFPNEAFGYIGLAKNMFTHTDNTSGMIKKLLLHAKDLAKSSKYPELTREIIDSSVSISDTLLTTICLDIEGDCFDSDIISALIECGASIDNDLLIKLCNKLDKENITNLEMCKKVVKILLDNNLKFESKTFYHLDKSIIKIIKAKYPKLKIKKKSESLEDFWYAVLDIISEKILKL